MRRGAGGWFVAAAAEEKTVAAIGEAENRAGEPVGKWGERAAKMGAEWVGCCCGGATKKWPQQRGETGELAEEPGKNGGRTGKMGG